ncbi:ankyrin repeat and fibronectin type-III domain-containing protein 1 isoform X2 [Acipenser ruthenus]|nr:ankyrin repeat and fibronectin type-III domain-containing protein 1 isoform X2 [Acipenser ruthenus]XP_058848290.1 ankyrin repeat and fibronectin type-III domain-containing protein 1 isoform X2 [Acipenser ruthenus]
MSLDREQEAFSGQERTAPCAFALKGNQAAAEDDSVLEMLSCAKFSDLEAWLCMPSTLLPRALESAGEMIQTQGAAQCHDQRIRPVERKVSVLGKSRTLPLLPFPEGSTRRKRRRLPTSPGGLLCNRPGARRWEYDRAETLPSAAEKLNASNDPAVLLWEIADKAALRKSLSADERLLQQQRKEQHKLLSRLEKGRSKLRNIHSLGSTDGQEPQTKTENRIARFAQRLNQKQRGQSQCNALNEDFRHFMLPGSPGISQSLDRNFHVKMTQQMQNLHLSHAKKSSGPSSPSAAKRLYRNLSEKLKGSHSSFDEPYFFGRSDRLRKASVNVQCSEALFEAVEQQDLDAVQLLLYQYSAEELDLNTPNSAGLTPLDIAIMTNNVPMARVLLKAGAKESPHFVSQESRVLHLSTLVQEAQRRVSELSAQATSEGLSLDSTEREKQLKAWEWRYRLYKRMKTGFEHARAPETPSSVRLTVTSSTSLTVTFQEPLSVNSAVVTRYRVEWSCSKDFSTLAGEIIMDNLQSLRCTIAGLTTGQAYYVQVSAYNMKGWGSAQGATPDVAAPSNWKEYGGREPRRHTGQIEALERLLQQVRSSHQRYSCRESSKSQNPSRKQSVSRSLKHLFHSSNKFVKTLKRGLYVATVFYHKDDILVTNEDQIPIVEIDDSFTSSIMQDFLWFTKLSCMWEDVRWLRQSMSVSMSSSSVLQARQKMLAAAGQLQNLLGTHHLGRVYYEPIKDRHGNVLLVTVREVESLYSFFNGKWMQISKLQSQRKSLSTPDEPTALDVLLITIQDVLSYQRRSQHRLSPGLYLGYLKLCSSVDQIKVLVPQKLPNVLCHSKIRDNCNVSRDEWEWLQKLSGPAYVESTDQTPACHTQLFFYELQMAVKALLKQINLPLHQARHLRLYTQEVLELGHNVSFLLLLPASDDVCTAPGQSNPYTPLSGFLNLPLQMFELVHFCTYKEKFISLYCRLSAVLDLDSLITQQSLREAISDTEVASAKQRHQQVLDNMQQMDEMWREMRWIMDVLQYARYKQPVGGLPVPWLVDSTVEHVPEKNDSTSSHMDYLPTPSPSPEMHRRKAVSDSQPCSDEEGCSEVFLPTDSDYDSSDALSPRELDLVYSSSQDISQQVLSGLSGSAPDVLQVHDLKSPLSPREQCNRGPFDADTDSFTKTMGGLTLRGTDKATSGKQPGNNPHSKRKLLSKHHHHSYFSCHHRWLRVHSESQAASLSEGLYTQQRECPSLPLESACGGDMKTVAELPRSSFLPHASSLPEEGKERYKESKPNVRRIFVEPCRMPLSNEGLKAWTLNVGESPPAVGDASAVAGSVGQDIDSDDQTNSQVSEIFSSTL